MTVSGSRRGCSTSCAARAVGWRTTLSLRRVLSVAVLWAALMLVRSAAGAEPGDGLTAKEKTCNDNAAAWFKKNWPDGKASTPNSRSTATYASHYHTTREKCFILGVVNGVSYSWQGTLHTVTKQLIDLDANRAYATFMETNSRQSVCIIEGRQCEAQGQWDMLVRALYFEDETAKQEALKQQK